MNILHNFNLNKTSVVNIIDYIISTRNKNLNEILYEINLSSEIKIKKINFNFILNFLLSIESIILNKNYVEIKQIKKPKILFEKFCIYFITEIIKNEILYKELFINSEYNVIGSKVIIDINSVKLNYRGYYKIFHQLGIVKELNENKLIIINYTLAKNLLNIPLKAISLKEFEKELENKKIRGEMAEKYVMDYELDKLKKLKLKPFQVSKYNVSAGYDIDSYNLKKEKIFIEVKSIIKDSIYWTHNEINTSKRLLDKYFIYCVKFKNGKPYNIEKIIDSPFNEIFINNVFTKKSTGDYQVFLK